MNLYDFLAVLLAPRPTEGDDRCARCDVVDCAVDCPVKQESTMPYLDDGLPFSGITSQSRHASYQGATDASVRAPNQTRRYLDLLQAHPDGMTDWEAAHALGWERTTINARRVPLVRAGLVRSEGFRMGPTGIRNTVWIACRPQAG